MTGLQPAPEAPGTDVPALLHPFAKPSLSSHCFVRMVRGEGARSCGATGTLVLRADSAFYQCDVIAAVLRRKACFSITARQLPPVRNGIESIAEDAWTPIKYTNASLDEDSHQWTARLRSPRSPSRRSRPKPKPSRSPRG